MIQKRLLNIRPPRVKITYDVEKGSAIEKKELPFTMGVISDLYGHADHPEFHNRKFISIDRDNFDEVMVGISPKLSLSIANHLSDDSLLKCSLGFHSIQSFTPDGIIQQLPELKNLIEDRKKISDLLSKADSNTDLLKSLLKISGRVDFQDASKIATDSQLINEEDTEETQKYKIETIVAFSKQIKTAENLMSIGKVIDLYGSMSSMIVSIDEKLSKQIHQILHHPEFQELEARWRGLYELVRQSETGESLKIKVFTASREEIYDDLSRASEFDQSRMFKLIYEEEYGTIGGLPFSCLVVDMYFGKSNLDIQLISLLGQIASAAHTPLLAAAKPSVFDLKTFMDIQMPRELNKIFDSSDSISWNNFRESEEARYVNLFLPQVLMRLPYGPDTVPVKTFRFIESVNGDSNEKFCWGNPAYFMAIKINSAVSKYGWAAAIRGTEGGGLVENLPAYTFKTSFGDMCLKCPTQTHITDRREKELSDLGFIALCHKKMTGQAVFFSGQSLQKAKKYNDLDANANSMISARMPYMLNASRFAHYIKVIMRDKIGSFQSARQIQNYLQNWIAEYVLLLDDATHEVKSEYPLREAKITVSEILESPGEYDIIMHLRPHFQMEGLRVSLRFVARIESGNR